MPRQRLGVVLLLPQPIATEIDGVRRALDDPMRDRVPPHITLVPPVNVRDRDLAAAVSVVRSAAADIEPLNLRIGPGATFEPAEPVVYLQVRGDLDAHERLRRAVLTGPLERTTHDPWVPHVTVAASTASARIPSALVTLARYEVDTTIDRVHLLAEEADHVWRPLADAPLGERARLVGRGGIEIELQRSDRPDPEAVALLALDRGTSGCTFALTARRDGSVVGASWGWTAGEHLEIADLAVAQGHRGLGIGRRLLAAVEDEGRRRGCSLAGATLVEESAAAASLLSASGWTTASHRRWTRAL
jgi:2'-5' RNA ligase